MKQVALTTVDNPFDPIKQFDDWYNFDERKGYCTCGYIARIAKTSDSLTVKENQEEIERAIDQIIHIDPFGLYKKVTIEDKN